MKNQTERSAAQQQRKKILNRLSIVSVLAVFFRLIQSLGHYLYLLLARNILIWKKHHEKRARQNTTQANIWYDIYGEKYTHTYSPLWIEYADRVHELIVIVSLFKYLMKMFHFEIYFPFGTTHTHTHTFVHVNEWENELSKRRTCDVLLNCIVFDANSVSIHAIHVKQ